MGTLIASAGVIPQQELPQDKKFAVHTRLQAEARTAVLESFESTLALNRRLEFEVNHESHEVIVKVIDGETDKVIKVFPPEELQRLHDSIKETIGLLFNERV
jgi:flagellar protein FlaG